MTSPEIIETEGNRILDTYFDKNKIKNSDNPHKEFLRQANKLKQFGIIRQLKENYTMSNKLFKKLNIRAEKGRYKDKPTPLQKKVFKSFSFGQPQLDLKSSLKAAATRTGTRIIISSYKGTIKAFEKWSNRKHAIEVARNRLGQFAALNISTTKTKKLRLKGTKK